MRNRNNSTTSENSQRADGSVCPFSIAAGNGLHDYDGTLEDFSAAGIISEVQWYEAQKVVLGAFDAALLAPDEYVDRSA